MMILLIELPAYGREKDIPEKDSFFTIISEKCVLLEQFVPQIRSGEIVTENDRQGYCGALLRQTLSQGDPIAVLCPAMYNERKD